MQDEVYGSDLLVVEKEIEQTDFKKFKPRKNAEKRKAGEWKTPDLHHVPS